MMEYAATSEVCRTQLWRWLRLGTKLKDGRTMTSALFRDLTEQELREIERQVGEGGLVRGNTGSQGPL